MMDLRYIGCILLQDEHGINNYGWDLLEEEMLVQGITDVSNCVKTVDGRCYITEEDFIRLVVP